jgi:hypothetical protein
VSGAFGGLEDRLDRGLARLEIRREAALVADSRGEPALAEHVLQRVVDLRTDPQTIRKCVRADGNDHELLQVDRVGSVCAAVDDVQHRHGQRRGGLAAEVAVERLHRLRSRCLRDRERDTEDRVGAEPALVRRAVEVDQPPVQRGLVERVEACDLGPDLGHVGDRPGDALAAPLRAAVTQLDRLVHTCRSPRGNGGAPERAGLELDVHLDRGIPPRVEDPAAAHVLDRAHPVSSLARS